MIKIQTYIAVLFLVGFSSAANKSCECKPAVTFGKNYSASEKAEELFETFSYAIDRTNAFIEILKYEKNTTTAENKTIEEVEKGLEEFIKIEGEQVDSENELNALVDKVEGIFDKVLPHMKNLTKELSDEASIECDYLIAVYTYYSARIGDVAECTCAKRKKKHSRK